MAKCDRSAEQALLAAIVACSDDPVVGSDLNGVVLAWNDAAEHLFGYRAADMIGQPISRLLPPGRTGEDAELLAKIAQGARVRLGKTERCRKDGEAVSVSITVAPVRDAQGTIVGAATLIQDPNGRAAHRTRIYNLQVELAHRQRLSELAQLVSALVHEVNQPLTAITNYLGACRRLAASGNLQGLEVALERIAGQTNRTRDIAQRARDFVRRREPELRPENLAQVIDEVIEVTAESAENDRPRLTMQVDRALSAHIDRVQIQQVLISLLRNAIEAMQGQPKPDILVAARPADDGMVEVSVVDCGPGLRVEVQDVLFQPLVTTKEDGMGMGLSVCRAIVEAHAGRLWLEPNPGGGTAVRFTVRAAR